MLFLALARIGTKPTAPVGDPAQEAFTHLQSIAHILAAHPAEDVKDTMDGACTAGEPL